MPTNRKSSAIGTPNRCEARLNSTLTASRMPQVVSSSAIPAGSAGWVGTIEVTIGWR